MKANEFIDYWNKDYPGTLPTNHELKWKHPDRWFRIHSLPEAKRYADSEDEYNTVLERQNQLITDVIDEDVTIFLSFGLYENDMMNGNYKGLLDSGDFQHVLKIDLHKLRPEANDEAMYYDIFVRIETWKRGGRNEILKAIANDEIRAMFFCPSKKCVVAPYDGGVDVIVESTETCDRLKASYRDWLSKREDGL